MTRFPCSGCGEMRCEGRCFDESSPEDIELGELLSNWRAANPDWKERHAKAMADWNMTQSDPLRQLEPQRDAA